MFRWLCSLSCCAHVSPPNDIWLDPRSRGRFLEQTANLKMLHRYLHLSWHFWTGLCSPSFWAPGVTTQSTELLPSLGWSYMQSPAQTQTYASTQRSSLHIYLYTHTCTHTHTLTHMHAWMQAQTHTQKSKVTQAHTEKNLLRTFIGFRKRRTTLPFTWSPAVYTPRGTSKRISKISNFIMKSACTHTHQEHPLSLLSDRAYCLYYQVIRNFFLCPSTRYWVSGLKHISSEHNKC